MQTRFYQTMCFNRNKSRRQFKAIWTLAMLCIFNAFGQSQSLVINRNAVAEFEHIPDDFKKAAEQKRLLFMDRSVGANISSALDCLSNPWVSAPSYCKRYQHRDSQYAVMPSEVFWQGIWDRSLWRYEFWPSNCSEDVQCFVDFIEPRVDSFDVMGCQFSYLAVLTGSKVADPVSGFFGSKPGRNHAKVLEDFHARHPDKQIIWWTTSLARGIGTPESQAFNDQMREYARTHSIVLFDVADILSHDPTGKPCYDNRDGIDYLDEMHPDDGLDIPAICPQYTTETEGGHLGSIAAGGIRVAKAFWVLMARLAGWSGQPTHTNERSLGFKGLYADPVSRSIRATLKNVIDGPIKIEILNAQGMTVYSYNIQGTGENREITVAMKQPCSALYLVRCMQQNRTAVAKCFLP